MQKLNSVSQKFLKMKLQFLGYLSNDVLVSKAVKQQKPFLLLFPECSASKNIIEMSKKVIRDLETHQKDQKGIKDFFNKFLFFTQDK